MIRGGPTFCLLKQLDTPKKDKPIYIYIYMCKYIQTHHRHTHTDAHRHKEKRIDTHRHAWVPFHKVSSCPW